jgi:hypothetical protein
MMRRRIATIGALVLASILAGECAADHYDPRIAQYSLPNVPGGLPGMAVPPPAPAPVSPAVPSPSLPSLSAPSLSAPAVRAPAPSVAVPPPPPPAARAPEAHGAEVCDCTAEADVPVYANGQIVAWRRERHLTGHGPQCCPR